MTRFNSKEQVALAAAYWVFGGDNSVTASEKMVFLKQMNTHSTWKVTDRDIKWVGYIYSSLKLELDEIKEAILNDLPFRLLEKYELYAVICGTMLELKQGGNDFDGWVQAGRLREVMGISTEEYNKWTKS